MPSVTTDILLCLTGVIGGVINSMAGGGGILMFPALLAAGLPAIVANATSSLVVWPGALTSAFGYRKELARVPKYYAFLIIPAGLGAIIGSVTLVHTSGTFFEKLAPWLVSFAVLLLVLQPLIHRLVEARATRKKHKHPLRAMLLIGLMILPLAIYAGYFGVGYGIMVLALLSFTHLKTIHQMNGIKNLSGAIIAIFSTIYFSLHQLINWRVGLLMAAGTAIGGILGARLALKTPARVVYDAMVVVGSILAILLFVKTY